MTVTLPDDILPRASYVVFPGDAAGRLLVFYLAAEEYLARKRDGTFFFLWKVPPTVIFGRHQDMEAEVNVPFCECNGIRMFRRKSGGGCVYADEGNLMVSFVTGGNGGTRLFNRFISAMAQCLRDLSYDAVPSGRNDILVSGRKVSGSAFYGLGGRDIIHATLLYDVNLEMMQNAITPSAAKLGSKGISSVRQRVANLNDFHAVGLPAIGKTLKDRFCSSLLTLSGDDMAAIERIMEPYLDDKFIKGLKHNGKSEGNMSL